MIIYNIINNHYLKKKWKIVKKDKRRRESLKRAQAKFKNVSKNLSLEDYEKFEKKIIELELSKFAYLKKLIMDDLS